MKARLDFIKDIEHTGYGTWTERVSMVFSPNASDEYDITFYTMTVRGSGKRRPHWRRIPEKDGYRIQTLAQIFREELDEHKVWPSF